MKRDWDLIREILLYEESRQNSSKSADEAILEVELLEAWGDDKTTYHYALLIEAGFLNGTVTETEEGYTTFVDCVGIKWAGHDLLDSIRDNGIWEKTKTGASKIGGWSIEIIKDLAAAYIKQKAKENLGFDL